MNDTKNFTEVTENIDPETAKTCSTESCGTGVCSPCLLIWGGVGIYLLVIALMEVFQ